MLMYVSDVCVCVCTCKWEHACRYSQRSKEGTISPVVIGRCGIPAGHAGI